MTVENCIEKLKRALGIGGDFIDLISLFESYFDAEDAPASLVLLFDEYDRYAYPIEVNKSHPGKAFFSNLETAKREMGSKLGIIAAGGIGVYIFRDYLGSPFSTRAEHIQLSPFGRNDLIELSQPFADRGFPLDDETRESLLLATGGNPALITFGLGELWKCERPSPYHVKEIFSRFRTRHDAFILDVHKSFADPSLSRAPEKVWAIIKQSNEPIPRQILSRACAPDNDLLTINYKSVLVLMEAAGLIQVNGPYADDPIDIRPIAGILNLPDQSTSEDGFEEHLLADVVTLLGRLHAFSVDFFRPGKSSKELVPEAVFSAFIAMGLEFLGWQTEREAQSVAGRTDIKVRRPGKEGLAVLEVKIWGRNDYKDIHKQVLGYWSDQTTVGMAITLTDRDITDCADQYLGACLENVPADPKEHSFPLQGFFHCRHDAVDAGIDHLLLKLPRK